MNEKVWEELRRAVSAARGEGCAVYILTPDELGGVDPRLFEEELACRASYLLDGLGDSEEDDESMPTSK